MDVLPRADSIIAGDIADEPSEVCMHYVLEAREGDGSWLSFRRAPFTTAEDAYSAQKIAADISPRHETRVVSVRRKVLSVRRREQESNDAGHQVGHETD